MAALSAIRAGIATNLRTIAGLRVNEELVDNPQPPVALVALDSIDYHEAMRDGLTIYRFTVQVIVARAAERHAQRSLDLYADVTGASSVKAAIESNRTMNGTVFDTVVETMPSVGSIIINDQTYLAAEFQLAVYA